MIDSKTYRGYTIEIHQDDGHGSHPRHDWDPVGTLASWDSSQRIKCECDVKPDDDDIIPEDDPFQTDQSLWQLRYNYYLFNVKIKAILPVFERYNGYSTVGEYRNQIGLIYMTKDAWNEHFEGQDEWREKYHSGKTDREIAEHILKGEIESLDLYARGEIYGYNVEELNDSCWGFFGDYEESGLLDEAKSVIDYHIERQCKRHFKQLKAWIKYKVNLFNRHGLSFN